MFEHPSLFKEAISLVLDFVPLVGSGKSAAECISGKDLVTGEHINRWLAAGGIILGLVPFGKLLTKGEKSTKLIENIAAKIVYDADDKQHLIEKMKRVIPTHAEEVDHRFIMEEISARVNPAIPNLNLYKERQIVIDKAFTNLKSIFNIRFRGTCC